MVFVPGVAALSLALKAGLGLLGDPGQEWEEILWAQCFLDVMSAVH